MQEKLEIRFDPWIGEILWRRAWQPTPVFLPGEFPSSEELGGLQSTGSQRVGHDFRDLACTHSINSREHVRSSSSSERASIFPIRKLVIKLKKKCRTNKVKLPQHFLKADQQPSPRYSFCLSDRCYGKFFTDEPFDPLLPCPILCSPMDCSPPGPSVHGISQVRILERLPFPSPGRRSLLDRGIKPVSPALAGRFFTTGPPGKH